MPSDPNIPPTANTDDCVDDGKICWLNSEDQQKLRQLLELALKELGTLQNITKQGLVSSETLTKYRWAAGLKKYEIKQGKSSKVLPFFQGKAFENFVTNICDRLDRGNKIPGQLRNNYQFQTYTPSKSERLEICQTLLGSRSNKTWNQQLKRLLNIDLSASTKISDFFDDEISASDTFIDPGTSIDPITDTPTSPSIPPLTTQVYLLVTCRTIEKSKASDLKFNIIPEVYAPGLPSLENVFKTGDFHQFDPDKGCSKPHQEIQENLQSWVKILEQSVLDRFGINQTEQSNIVIDLFLPHDLLMDIPESWEVLDDWDDCCLLGKYRGVILRSLDRVIRPGLGLNLANHWQTFQTQCLQSRIKQGLVEIARDVNPQSLEPQLAGKSIALFPGGLPEDAAQGAKILKVLLKSSVMVAVWPHDRPTDIDVARQHLGWVIQRQYLEDFGAVAIALKEARCAGEARGNVSFLADCPDRIPRMLQSSPLQMPREA